MILLKYRYKKPIKGVYMKEQVVTDIILGVLLGIFIVFMLATALAYVLA